MSTESKTNPIMTYEGWRISFQSSEQAARSAYRDFMDLWQKHVDLQARFDELVAENQNFGIVNESECNWSTEE